MDLQGTFKSFLCLSFTALPRSFVYFLQDGEMRTLYWLHNREVISPLMRALLYRKISTTYFVPDGRIEGLNLDLCYPHRSFDRQRCGTWTISNNAAQASAVPFNERRLEDDFEHLADFLLETGQGYFLYRDFQTANVMLWTGTTVYWLSGGERRSQYDVARSLWCKNPNDRWGQGVTVDYYIVRFCDRTGRDREIQRLLFRFSIIRVMQASGLSASEDWKKPTFTESSSVELLNRLTVKAAAHTTMSSSALQKQPETSVFVGLKRQRHL